MDPTDKHIFLMEDKKTEQGRSLKKIHRMLKGDTIRVGDLKHLPISEKQLQMVCVAEFRRLYPELANQGLLFHVPNETAGVSYTKPQLKANGVCNGVSDLILLVPRHGYGCLCVELKTPIGVHGSAQKAWMRAVQSVGQKYVICRTVEDFIREINTYLR